MKKFPTIKEAETIFEKGMKDIYLYEPDAAEERIDITDIHSHLVAKAAYMIAQRVSNMDKNRAYVLGLLHDYGKFCGDCWGKSKFHGLLGYYKMLEMGYPDIAKANLTHSFINKDFALDDYEAYHVEDLKEVKKLLNDVEYDDYDKLIQLADLLVNNINGFNSIRERMKRIQKWYKLPDDKINIVIRQAEELRRYFEKKCNCDIYELLNITEI